MPTSTTIITNIKYFLKILMKILISNICILFSLFGCMIFDNIKYNSLTNYTTNFVLTLGLKMIIVYFINNKINKIENKENQINYFEHKNNILSHTVINTLSFMCINNFILIHKNNNMIDFLHSLIKLYPIFFIYEIIFDFFYFSIHYLMHYNKFLYTNVHKMHHESNKITVMTTFSTHPIEYIISVEIPTIIILLIFNNYYKLSLFEYLLIFYYRTQIEIFGHAGDYKNLFKYYKYSHLYFYSKINKFLNIELTPHDHYLHHKIVHANYSKRNTLFDKMFGTYKE
jgi:sterol desaturase/sphingolipid hydroxylase (fatty acid hydroxylase superfamily)